MRSEWAQELPTLSIRIIDPTSVVDEIPRVESEYKFR